MNVGITIPAELPAAAETYAAAGVKIFRVRPDKAPYKNCRLCAPQLPSRERNPDYIDHRPEDCRCGVSTCHGFWASTTDLATVRQWWKEEPHANIGAPCKLNGWAVVDVDPRNGGDYSLRGIEQMKGVLPGTAMQITGGDGLHILYRSPGFDLPGEPFPGIDFKHNGYILLAPSVHSSGLRYQWYGDRKFYHPEVPWPATLFPPKEQPRVPGRRRPTQSVSGVRRPGKHWTVDTLVQHVMDSSEGNRNASLYFAACRANETADAGHLDLYDAETALADAGRAVGLAEGEVAATIKSAARRSPDNQWAAA
ncbi:bifunctional DNA primase/polymerase [Streptomyces sp. NPDC057426]|uniref:bifunctional DNA primase/polymerase n=1 Tax=Streptomyces sp. NPDC057426 TaxID=3346128 RepID=UPI00368D7F26